MTKLTRSYFISEEMWHKYLEIVGSIFAPEKDKFIFKKKHTKCTVIYMYLNGSCIDINLLECSSRSILERVSENVFHCAGILYLRTAERVCFLQASLLK